MAEATQTKATLRAMDEQRDPAPCGTRPGNRRHDSYATG